MTDFSKVTPYGGDCLACEHLISGECAGCLESGGKRVKMWENQCEIFSCCMGHGVKFCGQCGEFPDCEKFLKICVWDKNAEEHHKKLAAEYQKQRDDFQPSLPALRSKIGSHGIMTLSTCAGSRVTSRSMSVVVVNGKFYCQTDENYLKYRQIQKNENVSLCVKNFSIEGKCKCIGKPSDESNNFFLTAFKKHFFGSYKAYSALPSEILLEITPTLIYSWNYVLAAPYMEYRNFEDNTYMKRRMN